MADGGVEPKTAVAFEVVSLVRNARRWWKSVYVAPESATRAHYLAECKEMKERALVIVKAHNLTTDHFEDAIRQCGGRMDPLGDEGTREQKTWLYIHDDNYDAWYLLKWIFVNVPLGALCQPAGVTSAIATGNRDDSKKFRRIEEEELAPTAVSFEKVMDETYAFLDPVEDSAPDGADPIKPRGPVPSLYEQALKFYAKTCAGRARTPG